MLLLASFCAVANARALRAPVMPMGARAGPSLRMEVAEAPATTGVTSWYDSGVRLTPSEAPPAPAVTVTSWYDAGVRLTADEPMPAEPEPAPVAAPSPPPPPALTASAEASLFAALLSGIAVLGVDVASFGVIENADAALLVGGLALSQVDSAGPVGATLRTLGNVTSFLTLNVAAPTISKAAEVYQENELGYKARALLEMGIEAAIYAADPNRKERDAALQAERQAEIEAERRAAEEAARRAEKDALPWWSPDKYA